LASNLGSLLVSSKTFSIRLNDKEVRQGPHTPYPSYVSYLLPELWNSLALSFSLSRAGASISRETTLVVTNSYRGRKRSLQSILPHLAAPQSPWDSFWSSRFWHSLHRIKVNTVPQSALQSSTITIRSRSPLTSASSSPPNHPTECPTL